jgi:DNA-3-methyladenine glycosylase I
LTSAATLRPTKSSRSACRIARTSTLCAICTVRVDNRGKIQATVDNARATMSASPDLAALTRSYEINRKRAPRSLADLPKSTPQAEAFARQLKSQGYRFVGPTSVYAFMQNVGVVNDHLHGCFRATDYRTTAPSR